VAVTAGGRTCRREIRPQQSYLCSGDPRAHFGLGPVPQVDRLEVIWPDGARTVRTDVAVNQYLLIERPMTEGSPPP
jgi:hypothetical protein